MDRLWTKSFVLMTIVALLLFAALYLLLPTMPLFLQQLGGSESQVGLAAGAFTLSAVVCRPLVGGLLDRYGRRLFMLGGLLAFALSMYAYHWIAGIAVLMALRIAHGVSWAFSSTAVGTAVADVIPPARRGEGMGWFGMATTAAMAVGPMLGIWLMRSESFHGLFLAAAGLSVAALLVAVAAPLPFRPQAVARRIAIVEKSVLPVTATYFFLAVVYGGITTFVPLFAESIRVNAGTFFLVYALSLAFARPVAGTMADRYGAAPVIVPALAVTASAMLVLSFASGLAGVIAAAVLYGIGFGSAQPALQATNLRLAHPDRRGAATASFMTAFDLGIGLGSIALGWVSEYAGYGTLFMVGAASVIVAMFIFIVFVRKLLPKSPERENNVP